MGKKPKPTSRRPRVWVLAVLAGVAGLGVGWAGWPGYQARPPARAQLTLYQNPRCGCCGRYVDYLRNLGYASVW
ncbi:MAG: hypothetical protein QN158_11905 [Armatimonadota bacterium]|nr:hypothetical protein [Armatimonadota bacterium]